MKFAVSQKALVREFDFLRRAVPKGDGELPTIILAATRTAVTISATNGQLHLETLLANQAEAGEDGQFRLSSMKLDDVARTLDDQTLSFEGDQKSLSMTWDSGHCRFIANWQAGRSGYVIGDLVSAVEVDPAAFVALIAKLRFCYPSPNEARIPGIKFDCSDRLTVTCTNGTVVGVMSRPMERSAQGSFILPVTACDDIAALLRENKSEPLMLHFHAKHLVAVCGHRAYTTAYATSAVQFPDITRFFADPKAISADFQVADAKQALRRATAASTYDANESFRVKVTMTPGSIRMETLESSEEIGTYEGEPMDFVVNSKSLAGVLDAIGTPSVELSGSASKKPWLFQSVEPNAAQFILAPMAAL